MRNNPIPPILNTPEMVPFMWKFPTKPWFRLGGVWYERGMGLVIKNDMEVSMAMGVPDNNHPK